MANKFSLSQDQFYNLDNPIEVAMIIGVAREWTTIDGATGVPDTLRYPGKYIYDEDHDNMYIVDSSMNAILMNNVHIQVSENGTSWTDIQSYTGILIKYIKFSVDGGVTYSNVIPLSTADDLTAYDAHIANESNPHSVGAEQVATEDGSMEATVEAELLLNASHRGIRSGANPHGLIADDIEIDESHNLGDWIEATDDAIDGKIPKVTGSSIGGQFATLDVDGTFVASADVGLDGNYNLVLATSLFIGGSANSTVQSFTTTDNEEYALASEEADNVMDLVQHDKFHFTINHPTTIGLIAEDARLVGLPFTIILKGGTTGGTVDFSTVPWGADFDDIVLSPGDIWMVTGYVYSLNQYLVKAIEF